MFDITTGKWTPERGVLVEAATVPAGEGTPRQLVLSTPGLALVQHARGGVSLGGITGPSLTPLETGDRIILLPAGEFVLSLAVTTTTEQTCCFNIVTMIADPIRFATSIVGDREELTAADISHMLSRDNAVRLAIQRMAIHTNLPLPEELAIRLGEPLELLFGLGLREVLDDVVIVETSNLAEMLQPGDVVAHDWLLIERIGQGAAGDVWLVQSTADPEQRQALKVLRNPAVASLIGREARQIARLEQSGIDFAHIARLEGIVQLDTPGLLYEYVAGVGLRDYVAERGGRLSEIESIVLVQQLLSGLGALHQAGVVHRDLHPDNIIISGDEDDPQLKILDLGMATFVDRPDGPLNGSSLKSLSVLPAHPFVEQVPADSSPDPQSDLYSAGVLLWWMMTGSEGLPVGRRLEDEWSQSNSRALAVVQRATLDERSSRFQSAVEMGEALAKSERRWRPAFRRKTTASLAESTTQHSQSSQKQATRPDRRSFRRRHPFIALFSAVGLALSVLLFAPLLLLGGLVFLALRFSSFARTLAVVAAIVLAVPVLVISMILLTTAMLVFG